MKEESGSLEYARSRLRELARERGLGAARIGVTGRPLSAEEAIGEPGRRDFPITKGKERMLEARLGESKGQAFTDSAREFCGALDEVLDLALDSNSNRAIFAATLNAALSHLGLARGTLHCKDDDPESCADEIARTIMADCGETRVGLVGLNPAIAERLAAVFCPDNLRIADLDPLAIGTSRFGVEIWDGDRRIHDLIDFADVVLMTGTTLVNGTFDPLLRAVRGRGKRAIVYGVTCAGVCALTSIERLCPRGRDA